MAAKINWHGYGTKLRHCHLMYVTLRRLLAATVSFAGKEPHDSVSFSRILHGTLSRILLSVLSTRVYRSVFQL